MKVATQKVFKKRRPSDVQSVKYWQYNTASPIARKKFNKLNTSSDMVSVQRSQKSKRSKSAVQGYHQPGYECSSTESKRYMRSQSEAMYGIQKCYSFDQSFMDKLTVTDEAVVKLLEELGISGESNIDIKQIVEQNQEYFHHLQRNCACFKCSCCQCKCEFGNNAKLNMRNTYQTTYSREFRRTHSSGSTNTPTLTQSFYDNLQVNGRHLGKWRTTSQTYFTEHPLQERYRRPKHKFMNTPFVATSTNTKQYPDWQVKHRVVGLKRPLHQNVGEVPMMLESNYKKSYQQIICYNDINANDIKKLQNHQTFMKVVPSPKKSVYRDAYRQQLQQQHQKHQSQPKYRTETEKYTPIKAHKAHFDTANKRDFQFETNRSNCIGGTMIKFQKSKNNSQQKHAIRVVRK